MTTWHWVRHGPTHQKTFVGWRDVPADLSDTAQIARIQAFLPDDALVISSDLIRAHATADAIADGRTRLASDPMLREFHFGAWDNWHFSRVSDAYPDLSRAYWEDPGDIVPPGGESWNMAAARVATAVRRISAQHPARHIIAVAHIGVILTQVQRAMGWTPKQALAHKIDNLSVTRIDGPDAANPVPLLNHLP
ncbi:histidine phosphatase family protein [Pseudosulfitobacter pseudonitzschiae]|uniref:Phosphoglycerate mutase n=1 Tax=Pseudosulfitobacter pseudonitzschiae TaxID=1402135 RepID=A0A073J0L8_9RHOB|nr:histidine phosphatase family protein [Pseudosulfitobacter pseudonitzschiae]KEJ95499.1 phosphoglycerate mutase [Pseudosulfitobacter pseudonitzschiae]MBM1816053.1 histidine phosphatase family protein [Pseudosulfitobacter pseudonitzschiae]MBM1833359.1 histidine phosphatase family protein [Pseudosulfitobacter pseudonitzschiae]MBM1838226.1 histidine phosphatase family protein [Pseudosulfitobacter pseudonitzschiae]MBM1842758.1 histidine phosphatase family protein [Pseudosulfitobacter pseudonitzsc